MASPSLRASSAVFYIFQPTDAMEAAASTGCDNAPELLELPGPPRAAGAVRAAQAAASQRCDAGLHNLNLFV